MKTKFSALPSRDVTLTHGAQSITLTLRPLPIAYGDMIESFMPKPDLFVNGKRQDDPKKLPVWETRRLMLQLAKALGDQLETRAPDANAPAPSWEAYADAIKVELEAANLVEGDIIALTTEIGLLHRGLGTLGNG
jgi:hypothetical protein